MGDRVVFSSTPEKIGEAPGIWYTISYIEELHQSVEMDAAISQPKALTLLAGASFGGNGRIPWTVAPSRVRLLTAQENHLVDLQHISVQSPS